MRQTISFKRGVGFEVYNEPNVKNGRKRDFPRWRPVIRMCSKTRPEYFVHLSNRSDRGKQAQAQHQLISNKPNKAEETHYGNEAHARTSTTAPATL